MADEQKKSSPSERVHGVIDRIEEGEWAVIFIGENEDAQVDWPVELLPDGAEAGSHLRITITLDDDSRAAAEDKARKLQEELERNQSPPAGQRTFKL